MYEILSIIGTILLGYLTWNERDKQKMKQQLAKTLCKKEIEHLIDLKQLPGEVLHRETAQDIKEIKEKLDRLTERLLDSK